MNTKYNKMNNKSLDKKISRKEAIRKVGITALTSATLLFLDTKKASADSTTPAWPGYSIKFTSKKR